MGVSGTAAVTADEVKTGQISGKMMTENGAPLSYGTVLFFSEAIGPPPLVNRYMRAPENITDTDGRGKFSAVLMARAIGSNW